MSAFSLWNIAMKIKAKKGDLITDFLFKNIGEDDDGTERAFYALNTHVRSAVFLEDTFVTLPKVTHQKNTTKIIRSWD